MIITFVILFLNPFMLLSATGSFFTFLLATALAGLLFPDFTVCMTNFTNHSNQYIQYTAVTPAFHTPR